MNLTDALGWTLLNFLWQGAVVAVLLAGALAVFRDASSRTRYALSCAAMMLMPICALVTFLRLEGDDPPEFAFSLIDAAPALNYMQLLVWAWIAGVISLSLRTLGGWAVAERFSRRQTSAADDIWKERFAAIAERLHIRRPVRLAVSAIAEVPSAIGWLRPVVLVPASVFTGLAASQIEALLAHELAHIRRHDYLVNLLQSAIETLLFYHPAVWWVGRQIRTERENCCDDLAVEICGDRLLYAGALAELEGMRQAMPQFAMAASGGSLRERIERLLRVRGTSRRVSVACISAIVFTALLVGASVTGRLLAQRAEETGPPQETSATAEPENPAPAAKQRTGKSWLDEIEEAGLRVMNAGDAITLKSMGVDANYIRQIRATGLNPNAGELITLKSQDITPEFIRIARSKFKDVDAGTIITLKSEGVLDPQ
jgi:beta-lactamase regulating signal transducer with metallopeptidase domain